MRLKSVYIEEYKNIKNQTFDFSNNKGYIALIGLNGSGKSNFLEAIGIIFNGLMNNKTIPFKYEIQYELEGNTYLRKPYVSMINGSKTNKSNMIYPSSVIACYSSEDLRLWHKAFEDYYMHYFNKAINNNKFSPRFNYLNKYCWKIAFIALFCSEKTEIKEFLKTCLHISELTSINCHFTIDQEKKDLFKQHNALKWYNRIEELQNEDTKKEINANTIRTLDLSMYGVKDPKKNSQYIFQYLYLLSLPERNSDKGQNVDKLIKDIDISIDGISFDGLSEGEKKMILIECITQILGDEDSLILLDEPDAHTHIAMKKELLRSISQYKGQTIMTTHSPMFLNKRWEGYQEECIFVMRDGIIENTDPLKYLSELTDREVDYFEGSFILSSRKILVTEGPYDKWYLEKAIDVLKHNDKRYEKLGQIGIISSGGAGNAQVFYEQVLKPQIIKFDKIVFLFDYDDGGYQGWKKIRDLDEEKLNPIFYQLKYHTVLDQKPEDTKKTIQVEDLFAPESYKKRVDEAKLDEKKTHKDFRCDKTNLASAIKSYIEKNFMDFENEWYDNFRPVLDKLLDEFDL